MTATSLLRDYDRVVERLPSPSGSREDRMQVVVDALWDELKDRNCSWVGFYVKNPDGDGLVLGPRRDKPACSPISMFGACGRAFMSRKSLVVTDVNNLRAGYIACDPRDRSECVIPVFESYDQPYGVLDLDSYETHAFKRDDVFGLQKVLLHAGLTVESFGDFETV